MKRLFSLLCALTLVLALAAPAFAEEATPGQVADSLVETIKESGQKEDMVELTGLLNDNKSIFVSSDITVAMMGSLYAGLGSTTTQTTFTRDALEIQVTHPDDVTAQLVVSDLQVNNGTVQISLNFEGGVQSPMGCLILIEGVELDPNASYIWECEGQTGAALYDAEYKQLCFFAPHFSTYTIRSASGGRDYYYEFLANNGLVGADNATVQAALAGNRTGGSLLADTSAGSSPAFALVGAAGLALVGASALLLKKRSAGR